MCSPEPAVAVQELTVDPSALGRTQEADEVGAIFRKTDTTPGGLAREGVDLLSGHPPGIRWTGIDDVGCDALVSKLPRCGEDDTVQRSLTCAIRQVARNVVAGQSNDPTAATRGPEAPAKLSYEQPTGPCVHREVQIETRGRRLQDVAVHPMAVGEHQRCDGP